MELSTGEKNRIYEALCSDIELRKKTSTELELCIENRQKNGGDDNDGLFTIRGLKHILEVQKDSLEKNIADEAGLAYAEYMSSNQIQRDHPEGCWAYVACQIVKVFKPEALQNMGDLPTDDKQGSE